MVRICGLAFGLLLAASASAQNGDVWQGSFECGGLWGAMELTFKGDSGKPQVEARFTPQGHIESPTLREKTIRDNGVEFIASLEGSDYRFTGQQRQGRWSGTVASASGNPRQGTWAVTRLSVPPVNSPMLPAPTGAYSIGRTQFHWTDEKRLELETRIADDYRELIVYLFYPAERGQESAKAEYMPDLEAMRGSLKDEQIVSLQEVQTHSWRDAPVSKRGGPFPVVIVQPGGGQKVLLYSALLEELASHGFIIAAIQPPYSAGIVQLPSGKVLRGLPPAERGWETPKDRDDMPRIYEQMVIHWARDMSFVLDRIADLDKQDGRFKGRIDLGRVGAFGHSRGGQAAGKVRLLDSRFDAGVNLDGNIRGVGFPADPTAGGGTQPFLWLEKQLPWPKKDFEGLTLKQFEEMWANGDRLMQSIASEGIRITVARPEIDHLDFGDTAILNPALSMQARAGKLRTVAMTRKVLLAFFDTQLRGGTPRTLNELPREYPEIKLKRFGTAGSQRH